MSLYCKAKNCRSVFLSIAYKQNFQTRGAILLPGEFSRILRDFRPQWEVLQVLNFTGCHLKRWTLQNDKSWCIKIVLTDLYFLVFKTAYVTLKIVCCQCNCLINKLYFPVGSTQVSQRTVHVTTARKRCSPCRR